MRTPRSIVIKDSLLAILMLSSFPVIWLQEAFASTLGASIVPGAPSKTTGAYSPYPIKINVGDKVTWTNKDSTTHAVRSGKPGNPNNYFGADGSGNSILLAPTKTYSFTFTKPGVFPYFCTIHTNMVGLVIVGTVISINNVAAAEGDSGTKNFSFKVSREGIATGSSSVKYATADGTAFAGSDYVSKSGSVTFSAGETSKIIKIVVTGDLKIEPNEKFKVKLSSCVGCNIVDNLGIGTIKNDDP